MEIANLKIKIKKPFGNLFRETTVLIVKNAEGEYLLGAKPKFYPPTISRLLGGGIDKGESVVEAAQRELEEELNVKLEEKELKHKSSLEVIAIDQDDKQYNAAIHFVEAQRRVNNYNPGDDVEFIVEFSRKELEQLVDAYKNLSDTLWYRGEEGEFCWEDYGKVYSEVHRIALTSGEK